MDYFAAIVFSVVFLAMIYVVYSYRINLKKDMSEMEDVMPVMDEVKPAKMGHKEIYLSPADMIVWNQLPRIEQRSRIRQQKKLIDSGQLIEVEDSEGNIVGLITRKEAIEKGVI